MPKYFIKSKAIIIRIIICKNPPFFFSIFFIFIILFNIYHLFIARQIYFTTNYKTQANLLGSFIIKQGLINRVVR